MPQTKVQCHNWMDSSGVWRTEFAKDKNAAACTLEVGHAGPCSAHVAVVEYVPELDAWRLIVWSDGRKDPELCHLVDVIECRSHRVLRAVALDMGWRVPTPRAIHKAGTAEVAVPRV